MKLSVICTTAPSRTGSPRAIRRISLTLTASTKTSRTMPKRWYCKRHRFYNWRCWIPHRASLTRGRFAAASNRQNVSCCRETVSPVHAFWRHDRPLIEPRYESHAIKYKVALRKTEEGFSVSYPGLPGCRPRDETEREALENIADAIQEYLDVAGGLAADQEETEVREVEVAA